MLFEVLVYSLIEAVTHLQSLVSVAKGLSAFSHVHSEWYPIPSLDMTKVRGTIVAPTVIT